MSLVADPPNDEGGTMGLSPDAAALKEQALHNADAVARARNYTLSPDARVMLALAYLHGYEDGERMTNDTTIDAVRKHLGGAS